MPVRAALLAVISLSLMFVSLWWAQKDKDAVAIADFRYTNALTIALSNLQYHTPAFVGLRPIYSYLVENGLLRENHDLKLATQPREVLWDVGYINKVIQNARHLPELANPKFVHAMMERDFARDPVTTGPSFIMTHQHEDKGIVTWFRVALFLFHYDIRGVFYLYGLILFLTSLLFIYEYRSNLFPLFLLSIYATAHLILVLSLQGNIDRGPVINTRFIAVLGIPAAMHLFFLIVGKRPPDRARVLIAVLQAVTMAFLFHVRSTTVTQFLLLFTAAAYMALPSLRAAWRSRRKTSMAWHKPRPPAREWATAALRRFVGSLVKPSAWSGALAACGLAAMLIWTPWMQPRSFELNTNYHLTWHNILLSFKLSPDFLNNPKYAFLKYPGDQAGFEAVQERVRETEPDKNPNWFHITYNHRAYEKIVRSIVFEMIRDNPYAFLKLMFDYKPKHLVPALMYDSSQHGDMASPIRIGFEPYWFVIVALLALICGSTLRTEFATGLAFTIGGAAFALVPLWIAYPANFLISELALFILMGAFLLCGVLVAVLSNVIAKPRTLATTSTWRGE